MGFVEGIVGLFGLNAKRKWTGLCSVSNCVFMQIEQVVCQEVFIRSVIRDTIIQFWLIFVQSRALTAFLFSPKFTVGVIYVVLTV